MTEYRSTPAFAVAGPEPATQEMTARAIMDNLWPVLGGDQLEADAWHEVSGAVIRGLASVLPIPDPPPSPSYPRRGREDG